MTVIFYAVLRADELGKSFFEDRSVELSPAV
jgi:hypothetical protein